MTGTTGSVCNTRRCPTCGHAGPADDFYASTPECKPCKRERSRKHRASTARRAALADRLLNLLSATTKTAPGHGDCNANPRAYGNPTPTAK